MPTVASHPPTVPITPSSINLTTATPVSIASSGNVTSGSDWCEDLQGSDFIYTPLIYSTAVRTIIASAFILLMITTILGNSIIIIIVISDKPLRRITSGLVISMAAADILVAMCGELQSVVTMLSRSEWAVSDILCEVFTSADLYFSLSGLLHIVCLAADRYLAICYPFKYERVGHRFLVSCIILAWLLPLAFSFVPIMVRWHRIGQEELYACLQDLDRHVCTLFPNIGFSTISFLAMFAVPSALMCFCYLHIYRVAKRQRQRLNSITLGAYSDVEEISVNKWVKTEASGIFRNDDNNSSYRNEDNRSFNNGDTHTFSNRANGVGEVFQNEGEELLRSNVETAPGREEDDAQVSNGNCKLILNEDTTSFQNGDSKVVLSSVSFQIEDFTTDEDEDDRSLKTKEWKSGWGNGGLQDERCRPRSLQNMNNSNKDLKSLRRGSNTSFHKKDDHLQCNESHILSNRRNFSLLRGENNKFMSHESLEGRSLNRKDESDMMINDEDSQSLDELNSQSLNAKHNGAVQNENGDRCQQKEKIIYSYQKELETPLLENGNALLFQKGESSVKENGSFLSSCCVQLHKDDYSPQNGKLKTLLQECDNNPLLQETGTKSHDRKVCEPAPLIENVTGMHRERCEILQTRDTELSEIKGSLISDKRNKASREHESICIDHTVVSPIHGREEPSLQRYLAGTQCHGDHSSSLPMADVEAFNTGRNTANNVESLTENLRKQDGGNGTPPWLCPLRNNPSDVVERHSIRRENSLNTAAFPRQSRMTRKRKSAISRRLGVGHHEDLKAVRSISMVFLCFSITWTPYWLIILIMPYVGPQNVPDPAIGASLWLAYFGSALNPFVYYFSNTTVRQGISRLLRKIIRRRRESSYHRGNNRT